MAFVYIREFILNADAMVEEDRDMWLADDSKCMFGCLLNMQMGIRSDGKLEFIPHSCENVPPNLYIC